MTLADLTNQLYLSPSDTRDNIVELFQDRPQAIFYGPPGTGKTYIARELANHLTSRGGATKLVQFHPSYAYEDFVEGWRPTPTGHSSFVTLSKPSPMTPLKTLTTGTSW